MPLATEIVEVAHSGAVGGDRNTLHAVPSLTITFAGGVDKHIDSMQFHFHDMAID